MGLLIIVLVKQYPTCGSLLIARMLFQETSDFVNGSVMGKHGETSSIFAHFNIFNPTLALNKLFELKNVF